MFTFPLQIPTPGLKHLGHTSQETAHAGTGNEGAGVGGQGQTDTSAQGMLLWETKENRSQLYAVVLLQTARVCSLGKRETPQPNLLLAPSLLLPAPLHGNAVPAPNGDGGRGERIS